VALSDGEAALELGELALGVGRPEQAAPWLTTALTTLPDKTRSQLGLAQVELSRHHIPEADRLLAAVVASAPGNWKAIAQYAETQGLSGRFAESVRLYERALQEHPEYAYLHAGLGIALAGLGDEDRASAEIAEAKRLGADESTSFNQLSWYYLAARQNLPAGRAAEATIEIDRWRSEVSTYMAIAGSVAYRRASKEADARALLDRAASAAKKAWPLPAIRYLRNELSAVDLLREATDNDKRTEARTYIALNLLLSGKAQEALPHLIWVRDHGNRTYYEYFVALAELDALGPGKRVSGTVLSR
jgi:tetratricopeptide (TPR) repeat protein